MAKSQKKPENFLEALAAANLRLKAAKIPVQVVPLSNGNKLGLQATLPDKKDPDAKWHQQKISLGVPANFDGLEYAEAEARVVGGLSAKKQFSWAPYSKQKPVEKPTFLYVEDAIAALEEDYFKRRARTERSQSTWDTNYAYVYKKLIPAPRQKKLDKQKVDSIENEQLNSDAKPTKTRLTAQQK